MSEQNFSLDLIVGRLLSAQTDIQDIFHSLAKRVFSRSDIEVIFNKYREQWNLRRSTKVKDFIKFLLEEVNFTEAKLAFPSRTEIRYIWNVDSVYELAISLKPRAYYSHLTAAYLHGLIEPEPMKVYLNQEQPKPHQRQAHLEQSRIDAAFSRPSRTTNEITNYQGYEINIVHGQHTGGLGVVELNGPRGERLLVTDIERTLVDIAVRPIYASGASTVLAIYRQAKGKVSVSKLVTILKKMNYVYPYHQAVGFYLERSDAYSVREVSLLTKFITEYDFYLEHNMIEPEYSPKWRLYFPNNL